MICSIVVSWCLALPHVVKSYSMNFEIRKMSNNHCAMRNDLLTAFRSKVVLVSFVL